MDKIPVVELPDALSAGHDKSPGGNPDTERTTVGAAGTGGGIAAGIPAISPFDLEDGGTDAPDSGPDSGQPRRRGRPRGSRNRVSAVNGNTGKEAASGLLIADLEALLLSAHFMGAKILSAPEFELSASEAKQLSDAMKEVARHYPMLSMNPKYLAIMQLMFCAGGIYGPRIVAISKRPKKIATETQKVVQISEVKRTTEPSPIQTAQTMRGMTPSQLDPTPLMDANNY